MERFIVRDTITGTEIETAKTLEEAKKIINQYIADDIKEGTANGKSDGSIYKDDFDQNYDCFYEIYDTEEEGIIEFNTWDLKK